jgi:hypothetical protein
MGVLNGPPSAAHDARAGRVWLSVVILASARFVMALDSSATPGLSLLRQRGAAVRDAPVRTGSVMVGAGFEPAKAEPTGYRTS